MFCWRRTTSGTSGVFGPQIFVELERGWRRHEMHMNVPVNNNSRKFSLAALVNFCQPFSPELGCWAAMHLLSRRVFVRVDSTKAIRFDFRGRGCGHHSETDRNEMTISELEKSICCSSFISVSLFILSIISSFWRISRMSVPGWTWWTCSPSKSEQFFSVATKQPSLE